MKRALPIVAIAISALVVVATFFHIKNAPFALDSGSYGVSEIQTINLDDLQTLIDEQKSFGLFISQPACQASADLAKHLAEFTDAHSLKFYEISFSVIKDSDIIPELKFYPSFAIFHDGKVVDFLEANSDADAPAYTSANGFEQWFTKYVKLEV